MEPGQSVSNPPAGTTTTTTTRGSSSSNKPMPYNLPNMPSDKEEDEKDYELAAFLIKMEAEVQALIGQEEDKVTNW